MRTSSPDRPAVQLSVRNPIRAKLLQREVIQAPQRGYVQFAVPDLDIYLRENAGEILERFYVEDYYI